MKQMMLFVLLTCFGATALALEPVQIFLLVGQSNMAGRAKIADADKAPIPNVYLFNAEQKWEAAVPPYNRYAKQKKKIYTGINPGVGFAQHWESEQPVGIVCQARGGTSIEQWLAPDSKLYAAAISEAKAAQKTGAIAGILWHQGESNSSRSAKYPEQLVELVKRFRSDLGNQQLPFVFGQLGSWSDKYAVFNEMIVKQVAEIPHTACVTTEGLTAKDDAHFDRAGQLGLGKRYAEAMRKLIP